MFAAIIVSTSEIQAQTKSETPPTSNFARFHARLADLEARRVDHVTVLQIGDSHTASDHFSGRLRALLQQRFGDGGRGFLQPGEPFPYFRPYQIAVKQSPGWKIESSIKSKPDGARFGLSGFYTFGPPGETITIDLRGSGHTAIDVAVEAGTIDVLADDIKYGSVNATFHPQVGHLRTTQRVLIPSGTQQVTLRSLGEGVSLSGYSLIGARPGVRLANIGFPGAQIVIIPRHLSQLMRSDLRALDPALVILAFGTNEGFGSAQGELYFLEFELRVLELKRTVPNADVVVVGPPDANRFPRYCLPPAPPLAALQKQANASPLPPLAQQARLATRIGAVASAWPPQEAPPETPCRPLSTAERARYDQMLSQQDRALCRWHTPAAIPIVREAQRKAAEKLGVAFFDWGALFGGECGADEWTRKGLAHKDRVHFKQEGYARAADKLHEMIMSSYPATARAAQPSPPAPSGR